jgi:hypothetical protein
MSTLLLILTLARAGATSRAWDAFISAGLDGVSEIEVLTLKGRLLKDRAKQAATGAERAALFAQSGAAYAQASRLRPDSYPLINAAAMALFAGDGASAAALARDTLTLVDGDPLQGETPYWREATRAEAFVLLGRTGDAQASLTAAIRAAPLAWEDHAVTLRQFAAILSETRQDAAWLDHHRPAPSLHYRGILGIDSEDTAATDAIYAAIADIAPGFGYGALAAGADIIAAEALLAGGAELHVVLPSNPADFCKTSVAPYAGNWTRRYDALCAAAHSITICADSNGETSRAAIALAELQAMGMAASKAALLESRALALRIEPKGRSAQDDPWIQSGRTLVHVPVVANHPAEPATALPAGNLLYFLAIGDDAKVADPMGFATLSQALSTIPAGTAQVAIDCNTTGCRDTVAALLRNTLQGSIIASTNAAMALMAEGRCRRIEPLGDMESTEGPVGVYAVWLHGSP